MPWIVRESTGAVGPSLRMYANGLVVRVGDAILPTEWADGNNSLTGVTCYHVTTSGVLGAAPGANWPYAAAGTTGISCGSAVLRAGALYHFDFSAGVDGDGSQTSPFNTSAGRSSLLVSGNGAMGLARCGTVNAASTILLVGGSGVSGIFSWLTWYRTSAGDSEEAPLTRAGTNNSRYAVLDGLQSDGRSAGNAFSLTQGASVRAEHIYWRGCLAHDVSYTDGNRNGWMIVATASTDQPLRNVWFEYCEAYDCEGYGFGLESIVTDEGSENSVKFYRCIAGRNGTGKTSWGFGGYAEYYTVTSGWTDQGGGVYSRTAAGGVVHAAVHGGVNFHQLTKNTDTPTTPGAWEFGWAANVLYVNLNGDDANARAIWWTPSFADGVEFIECEAFGQHGADGSGMGADTFAGNWRFSRCYSHDNDGEGIVSNIANGTQIRYNLVVNNGKVVVRPGINMNNGIGLVANFNTVLNGGGEGIGGTCPAHAVEVLSNLICNNADVAVGTGFDGASSIDYNHRHNNAAGGTTGGNDITADPQLVGHVATAGGLTAGALAGSNRSGLVISRGGTADGVQLVEQYSKVPTTQQQVELRR